MTTELEVKEGLLIQHSGESIVRTVDFDETTTAASVSSPSVTVYEEGSETDITSTVMPTNSPSVASLVVTLSLLTALTAGKTYRVEVTVSDGTNTLISYHRVFCER